VFGLPVLGLQWLGPRLGGGEHETADRWVPLLQALLAGWIGYVAAGGMLFDGALRLLGRRGFSGDLFIAVVAIAAYLISLASVVGVFVRGQILFRPLLFHVVVILLIGWSGWRWWRLTHVAHRESRIGAAL
jgi:cation transport ATPase